MNDPDHESALRDAVQLETQNAGASGLTVSNLARCYRDARHRLDDARSLLKNLIDDEKCRLDHHGLCQTHRLEEDCSVAAARKFLKETP